MSEDRKNWMIAGLWQPLCRLATFAGLVFLFGAVAALANNEAAAAAVDATAIDDDVRITVADSGAGNVATNLTAGEGQSVTNAADSRAPESVVEPEIAAVKERDLFKPIERDPFWPVGFDPNPPPPPDASEDNADRGKPKEPPKPILPEPDRDDWLQAQKRLKYNVGSSTTADGDKQYFAFMNNKLMSIGQVVAIRTELFHFTWRVAGVSPTGVRFTPLKARRLSDGAEFWPLEE